jgi:elongation factor Ts
MAQVTAGMVKELRERTQAGMSDCKNALVEVEGDMEKAVEVLLKKGAAKAASRSGRIAAEGEVRTHVAADGKRGVIVEVNCQTDFVARGDDFRGFVGQIVDVAAKLPKGSDLLTQTFPGTDRSVDEVRQEMIAKTGENTVVRRWDSIEATGPGGIVHAYIHAGGKLAVLLHADAPSADALKLPEVREFIDDCAMQIAAMGPTYLRKEEVSDAVVAKQREIFEAQMKEDPKQPPPAAVPKILDGKINKWFTEVTLLAQESVRPDAEKKSVDTLRQAVSKKIGGELKILGFLRFSLGEGIEKKTDDLAEEVAKLTT